MARGIIENLIEDLTKLPGIGRKTAQRLAFHILQMPEGDVFSLSESLRAVKEKARFCSVCFNITESDVCRICTDARRDRKTICVVEEPANILAVERTGFKGIYHVLLGALSPADKITPDKLKIAELVERIKADSAEEVIVATNPNTKGEMTALYLKEVLSPLGVAVSRIAYGLPMGSDIEFTDEVTLRKAMEGRRPLQ